MKKIKKFLLFFIMSGVLFSCSKDADNSANSISPFKTTDINGTWENIPTSTVVEISMTTGNGIFRGGPVEAAAIGGNSLTGVTYISGGYWEAKSHTYFSSTGWSATNYKNVGLAMADDKKTFKLGNSVYTRR